MSKPRTTMKARPFEKIVNDVRWSGTIEDGAYVLRVGASVHTLRTVSVEVDDKGEYATLEPYEEPLEDGLWLRVEAEPDEWPPTKPICCRVSLQRVNPIYVDPNEAVRRMKIDPASVNAIGLPAFMNVFSILFYWGGKPTEWGTSRRDADGPASVH